MDKFSKFLMYIGIIVMCFHIIRLERKVETLEKVVEECTLNRTETN